MQPLNLAVLKTFAIRREELCLRQIKEELQKDYGNMRSFNDNNLNEILLCGKENFFINETYFEINADGNLDVYYDVDDDQVALINKNVPDR